MTATSRRARINYALYPVRLWLLVAKAAAYRLVGKELR